MAVMNDAIPSVQRYWAEDCLGRMTPSGAVYFACALLLAVRSGLDPDLESHRRVKGQFDAALYSLAALVEKWEP